MVFVKVRETYDLHTTKNKMTVIAIRTPKPDIIKRNFPGLLMQCKAYRPFSADVRVACASMQPLDPQGVGTTEGDVAPEDIFNPILYKAMSNIGMSQLEARIHVLQQTGGNVDVDGDTAFVDVNSVTDIADEFNVYYGLLSNAHGWKHANPQAGLEMNNLKPLVWEINYSFGDNGPQGYNLGAPAANQNKVTIAPTAIRGGSKPMPFINCTSYTYNDTQKDVDGKASDDRTIATGWIYPGFDWPAGSGRPANCSIDVPYIDVICAAIVVPPSRLHELYYRMVVEWTLEFSGIRPLGEICNFSDLAAIGSTTHYQNYSYESTKEAVTGDSTTILNKDANMISANVDVNKVM